MTFVARSQTIARIENDSLIIKEKLNVVVISDDHIDGNDHGHSLNYSENIEQILDNQNGVSLTRRGNYASEAVNRGMASERMNVTIDGMKIFSACTDKMDPVTSYISTNNLETVEIESGGQGKCFGSNVGGQLNMKTKEPVLNDLKKLRANISFGGNSSSMGIQSSFNTNYSEKNWALRLNGMHSKNDDYYAGNGIRIENSQYEKSNLGASLKTKLSTSNYLLFDFIRDDANDIGYPALPMDVSSAKADIYSMTYRHFFSSSWSGKMNFKIYGNNISHKMDDSKRDVVMRMDMPGSTDTYGSYFITEMSKERHHVKFVFDAYRSKSMAEMTMYPEGETEMYMLTWPDVQRQLIGVYASDLIVLKNEDDILLTARYDAGSSEVLSALGKKQFEVFDYYLADPILQSTQNYSIEYGLNLKNDKRLALEAAYSERLPSVSEQFGFYIFNSQDGFDYIGDPEIKNEESYKAEVKYQAKNQHWKWYTSVFGYHMPNYIFGRTDSTLSAMTIGGNGVKRYINLDYAQIIGFELDLSVDLNSWSTFHTAFTFNYGYDYLNRALPLMSPLRNTSELKVKYLTNVFNLKLISAADQNRNSEYAAESKSPAYAVVNFDYSRFFAFGKQGLTCIGGIENIFDTYYNDHLDWNSIPRSGRNFFLKFQFQF